MSPETARDPERDDEARPLVSEAGEGVGPQPDPEPGVDAGAGTEADADAEAAAEAVEADLDELSQLAVERDQYRDLAMRVQADFENFRKQAIRRQTEQLERAAEGLVEKLLPVLDAFDLARSHHPDDQNVQQLWAALWGVLSQEGLDRVDEVGASFDPNEHDAVQRVDGDAGDAPADGPVVADVLRAGYRWRGRVLRAAMVSVRGG